MMNTKRMELKRVFLCDIYITAHPNSDFSIPHKASCILTPDMTKGKNFEDGWLNFKGAKFLLVLDIEDAKIKGLPIEVGDLIHLTFLD
ncbi:hypothetical protein NC651_033955 [Populus alba x Populus x berolinensis]|nr:hypothetical protein NC651_033955 [Populus alba x Populus x berolinensis]